MIPKGQSPLTHPHLKPFPPCVHCFKTLSMELSPIEQVQKRRQAQYQAFQEKQEEEEQQTKAPSESSAVPTDNLMHPLASSSTAQPSTARLEEGRLPPIETDDLRPPLLTGYYDRLIDSPNQPSQAEIKRRLMVLAIGLIALALSVLLLVKSF